MNATDEFDTMLRALDRDLDRTLAALSPAQRRRALTIARGRTQRDAPRRSKAAESESV